MERNEFIKSLGLGIAVVCAGSCLSGCGSKSNDPSPAGGGTPGGGGTSGTKVNVDLSTQLLTVGSFLSSGGVLFVRTATGNTTSSFIATQATCPHQGGALNWIQANNLIQCSLHSSQYSASGSVITQPNDGGTTQALKIYSTAISGNTLTATIS
ncbi:QcrA and Rieske domain-containing protein [Pedobacter montanisoli]|uniref:Rieske 2Fe-2S domain-containing protein n=1 Tax=Pedobacter montanisoli TaxID=2923277 RepID=A0ABS9ZU96_9SPHI|nr:Rieske 2Fe-2S domain-containing protein [Pedobacter montanisoli]MCJ0742180.1 Rieske 2Fe-2S domain-containing protein [Pedobacter montanisoli]